MKSAPRLSFRAQRLAKVGAFAACTAASLMGGAVQAQPKAQLVAALQQTAAAPREHALNLSPEVDEVHVRLPGNEPLPALTGGRVASEMAGVNYRLWLGRGNTQMSVGVGTLGYVQPQADGRIEGPISLVGSSPTIAIGMRHRLAHDATVYADAYGTRGLGGNANDGYVDTKVGLEWKPAKQRFGIDHGALGIHLDSGYRIALRARHGGLGLYLRTQF